MTAAGQSRTFQRNSVDPFGMMDQNNGGFGMQSGNGFGGQSGNAFGRQSGNGFGRQSGSIADEAAGLPEPEAFPFGDDGSPTAGSAEPRTCSRQHSIESPICPAQADPTSARRSQCAAATRSSREAPHGRPSTHPAPRLDARAQAKSYSARRAPRRTATVYRPTHPPPSRKSTACSTRPCVPQVSNT